MSWFLVIVFAVISALGDSQGFSFATKIWKESDFNKYAMLRSYLGFAVGAVSYWFMVRNMQAVGVNSTELQTMIWFIVTIVCVGIVSGQILHWHHLDQAVAVLVLIGIGWLLIRVGN
ncbi:hypothetical protein BH09PAT2_BH09PAT2_08560 [soil metagenome]